MNNHEEMNTTVTIRDKISEQPSPIGNYCIKFGSNGTTVTWHVSGTEATCDMWDKLLTIFDGTKINAVLIDDYSGRVIECN